MRVVIADDDAVVVESLQIVLDAQPDIEVAGCGTDGPTPCAWRPMPRPTSFFSTSRCRGWTALPPPRRSSPPPTPPRVVFLTTFSDDEYIVRALALGAAGYLIKQDVAGWPRRCAR